MRDKLQAAQQASRPKAKGPRRPVSQGRGAPQQNWLVSTGRRATLCAAAVRDSLLAEADGKAREAIDILERCQLYPSLQYVALCHYAEVLRSRAVSAPELNQEVRRCLERAVALLEQPRTSLAEEELMRAEFLSQYTAAFDQLVAWHVENHDPAEAWSTRSSVAAGRFSIGFAAKAVISRKRSGAKTKTFCGRPGSARFSVSAKCALRSSDASAPHRACSTIT